MAKQTTTAPQSSLGKNILLGTLGVIVGAGIIYLLGSLIIYFLDRGEPELQQELPNQLGYGLLGYNASEGARLLPVEGLGSGTYNGTSGTTLIEVSPGASSSTDSTGSTPSQSTVFQPMIVFVPQQGGSTTTPVTPEPSQPPSQTNPSVSPTNANILNRSLLSVDPADTLDPIVNPSLLTNPSVPVNLDSQILPDNPLYGLKTANRFLQLDLTPDPSSKVFDSLVDANDTDLEGLTLLGKNISPNEDQLGVDALSKANDFVKVAQNEVQAPIGDNSSMPLSLLSGMSNSLLFQQLLLLAAENVNDNNLALQIENIRVDHLVATGNILSSVLNHSGNNLSVLSTFINASLQSPATILHTISVLNDLQNNVSLPVASSINVLQQSLITTLGSQLSLLSDNDQTNQLLVFVGKSPIRLLNGIQTLDTISALSGNTQIGIVTHKVSDIASNNLATQLGLLTQDQQVAFLNHFANGNLQNLKSLVTLEAHLRNTLSTLNDTADNNVLSNEILAAKKVAVQKVLTNIANSPVSIEKNAFIQHLLSKPDIYDLAVLDVLNQNAVTAKANQKVVQLLSNAQEIALTNFVSQLGNGENHLLPIPYTEIVLNNVTNNLNPQQQTILATAVNQYTQNLRSYVSNNVPNETVLQKYTAQLQNTPLANVVTPVTTNVIQPNIAGVVGTAKSVTNPVQTVQQTLPSVQHTVQQVSQNVVQTVGTAQPQQPVQQVQQTVNSTTNTVKQTVNSTANTVQQTVNSTVNNLPLLH